MEKQFVSFMVDQNNYCIDILDVQEVVRGVSITPVPNVPVYVKGIFNLRGYVVPVFSVHLKLDVLRQRGQLDQSLEQLLQENESIVWNYPDPSGGISASRAEDTNRLVIVHIDRLLVGLLVDDLDRVFSVPLDWVQDTSSAGKVAIHTGFVRFQDMVYSILSVRGLIAAEDQTLLEQKAT